MARMLTKRSTAASYQHEPPALLKSTEQCEAYRSLLQRWGLRRSALQATPTMEPGNQAQGLP